MEPTELFKTDDKLKLSPGVVKLANDKGLCSGKDDKGLGRGKDCGLSPGCCCGGGGAVNWCEECGCMGNCWGCCCTCCAGF